MLALTSGSHLGALLQRTPLGRLRARQARLLAAVLAAVAVWLVATPLVRAITSGDVTVVVLARSVAAGQAITTADVTTAEYPAGLVPAGALHGTGDAVGHRLAVAADPGEPLTSGRLAPTRSLAAGEVGVVLPVDADTAAALRPGDPARVLLTSTNAATTASPVDVRILTVYPGGSGKALTGNSAATTSVMVAARSQDANRFVTIHASSSPLVLIRPYS